MESLEKKFDDDFLYRMRDKVLQKVEEMRLWQRILGSLKTSLT